LAVRNEEGGFYLCQAMQNIHRASRRIRIRWLTQHPNDEFTPDFYDHTGKINILNYYLIFIYFLSFLFKKILYIGNIFNFHYIHKH